MNRFFFCIIMSFFSGLVFENVSRTVCSSTSGDSSVCKIKTWNCVSIKFIEPYSIPEDDLSPRKRARSSHRFKIGESSTAAAARQPGSTLARGTRFGFVAALEEANERVTDLATSPRHDSHNMHVRHQDAQLDRAVLQAHVASLEREA
ncbi:hypothetical protein Tco_0471370 [Tanacetum coccineum]